MKSAKQRILCIDNHASSNLAIYLLEQAGYEVSTASSIAEGIELAKSEHLDLHLLNHKLVDRGVIDACDRLDQLAPRTPILFYSTVFYPYQEIGTIHCRLHQHMVKPVSSCDVVANVSWLVNEQGRSVARRHVAGIYRKGVSVGSGAPG